MSARATDPGLRRSRCASVVRSNRRGGAARRLRAGGGRPGRRGARPSTRVARAGLGRLLSRARRRPRGRSVVWPGRHGGASRSSPISLGPTQSSTNRWWCAPTIPPRRRMISPASVSARSHGSTNLALAETFPGAVVVPFPGVRRRLRRHDPCVAGRDDRRLRRRRRGDGAAGRRARSTAQLHGCRPRSRGGSRCAADATICALALDSAPRKRDRGRSAARRVVAVDAMARVSADAW